MAIFIAFVNQKGWLGRKLKCRLSGGVAIGNMLNSQ